MARLKRILSVLVVSALLALSLPLAQGVRVADAQSRVNTSTGVVTIRNMISGVFTQLAGGVAGGTTYKSAGTLYWENTNLVTTATVTDWVLGTEYILPAGTLATNGDRLIIRGSVGVGTATTNTKNFYCQLGYTSFTAAGGATGGISVVAQSSASNAGTLSWEVMGTVTRLTSTTVSYEQQTKWGATTTTQGTNYATGSMTWANALKFICAVQNATASNSTVLTLNEYSVQFWPR